MAANRKRIGFILACILVHQSAAYLYEEQNAYTTYLHKPPHQKQPTWEDFTKAWGDCDPKEDTMECVRLLPAGEFTREILGFMCVSDKSDPFFYPASRSSVVWDLTSEGKKGLYTPLMDKLCGFQIDDLDYVIVSIYKITEESDTLRDQTIANFSTIRSTHYLNNANAEIELTKRRDAENIQSIAKIEVKLPTPSKSLNLKISVQLVTGSTKTQTPLSSTFSSTFCTDYNDFDENVIFEIQLTRDELTNLDTTIFDADTLGRQLYAFELWVDIQDCTQPSPSRKSQRIAASMVYSQDNSIAETTMGNPQPREQWLNQLVPSGIKYCDTPECTSPLTGQSPSFVIGQQTTLFLEAKSSTKTFTAVAIDVYDNETQTDNDGWGHVTIDSSQPGKVVLTITFLKVVTYKPLLIRARSNDDSEVIEAIRSITTVFAVVKRPDTILAHLYLPSTFRFCTDSACDDYIEQSDQTLNFDVHSTAYGVVQIESSSHKLYLNDMILLEETSGKQVNGVLYATVFDDSQPSRVILKMDFLARADSALIWVHGFANLLGKRSLRRVLGEKDGVLASTVRVKVGKDDEEDEIGDKDKDGDDDGGKPKKGTEQDCAQDIALGFAAILTLGLMV